MRLAALAALLVAAALAAGVLAFVFDDDSGVPPEAVALPSPEPTAGAPSPTPLPSAWLDAIVGIPDDARPEFISCRDANGDLRLDARDGLPGLDVRLVAGEACRDPAAHADYYAAPADRLGPACASGVPSMLVVTVASAGSDLLQPKEGESLGLIDIANALMLRADREHDIATWSVISTAAIFGAEQPQTGMEGWLAREVEARLAAAPCLRAVLIGHSHGGATVTSVTAALDARYGDRMLAVLIDRTTALYDRPATEMPARTPVLNFFQTNEGWHGVYLDAPNVRNFDESAERAPVAPSDGGGGLALVSHKTLDDAPAVQQRAVDAILAWAAGQ